MGSCRRRPTGFLEVSLRRSIATVSLSGGLQEKLFAAAAAKFDMVEIFENDLTFHDGSPADVRELLAELGLSISLFQPFTDFEATPDEVFRRNLERAERKFDLMAALGAPAMLVSSNAGQGALADDALAAAQLHELAERAAARGLKIGYQAQGWARHVRTWADAWRVVKAADHPALGLVLNSFHTLAIGDDPSGVRDIPGDRILLVQLADAPRLAMDLQTLGRHFRCFPGQGGLDVVGFTRAVLETGYDGPLSIEVVNDGFRALPTRQLAQDAARSLTFLGERLARTAPALADRAGFERPPAPPVLEGIGFIEFAVDGSSGRELAEWLTALGFAFAGRHRTKEVALYRQGEVLVVLNGTPDSFAHAYFLLHGPSVCAIALRTPDKAALSGRADAYDYKRYQERHGPNEHDLPAVRAPDGSLFNLVDGAYDPGRDFDLEPAAPARPGGVVEVDHIARAVPAGQFDSWLLYDRVLLGLEPDETLDLPEPHGLVRSRALASRDGRVRLPLTFSESSRTVVARQLSTFSGAGVNQIAFATDDIFAAVAAMRRAGARLLPIPANYYLDLAAQGSLPEATVERLREHGILYDRDGQGGEFFHAYTETFHDRFFFEIVQRTGGYSQYGAANAPVRMAAQALPRSPSAEGAWL
jgi:4-hydroxyphenylpyruvate dioxygenase